MLEKISFIGGLDQDTEDRLLQNGDYRFLLNGRSSITGVTENIPSTEKIDFALPSGTNKVIGALKDDLRDQVIYFVHNSNDEDLILEYDARSEAVTQILKGDIGFDPEHLINHSSRIGDLLFWTDGNIPPRKINIEKAKTGFYTINEQSVSAVKWAPNCPPEVAYESSSTSGTNNLKGKLYQFKYKWIYTDGEESAWGPISNVPTPNSEYIYYPKQDQSSATDNVIQTTVETGSYLVDRIKIAVRRVSNSNAPGDFYLVKDLDKDELGISDDSTYDFLYTGEDIETPIPLNDSNRLYDYMPLKAESMAVTEGNRLIYGSVTEGYDNIQLDATADPLYLERPEETTLVVSPGTGVLSEPTQQTGKLVIPGYTLSGTPAEGVVVSVRIALRAQSTVREDTVRYVVQPGDTYSDIIAGLSQAVSDSQSLNPPVITKTWKPTATSTVSFSLTAQFANTIDVGTSGLVNWYAELIPTGTTGQFEIRTWNLRFFPDVFSGTVTNIIAHGGTTPQYDVNWTSTGVVISTPVRPTKVFKSGSRHQLGLLYFDQANRSSLVQLNDQMAFDTEFYSNSRPNGFNGARVVINHQPPDWAYKWQLVYGGRGSVGRFVHFELGSVGLGSDGLAAAVLTPTTDYNTAINGVVTYDFVKGDRLRVILNISDEYVDSVVDVEVVGYDSGTNTITFKTSDAFDMTTAKLVELYAPRDEEQEVIFYEIGEAFPVINPGQSDRAHGTNLKDQFGFIDINQTANVQPAVVHLFDQGDVYYKERIHDLVSPTPDVFCIEDVNYSDFYASAAWNKGRPNLEDKNFSQKHNKARVYYTEPLVEGTFINGSSTIYDSSFKDYDRSYGAIKKLYAENTQLIMFQELKVFKVLVNESILYDSEGTAIGNLEQQQRVLSDGIGYAGEFGIGCNPESFAVYGNRKYFIDAERGAVLRLGLEGITPISNAGMQKYFSGKMKDLLLRKNNFNAYGGYDIQNGEYILAFETQPPVVEFVAGQGLIPVKPAISGETIAYNEPAKRWAHFYSFLPDYISSSVIELITFKSGEIFRHPFESDSRNNFYGTDYPMIVRTISNENPSENKFYVSIFTESNDRFSMPSATTQDGQETSLDEDDFEEKEGVFYAEFLRDQNTPNVTNPLLFGDQMRSHSMVIELQSEALTPVKLFAIGVRQSSSMLTNY